MEKTALKIGPPPSPNRDEFPFVGTANVQGLTIDLENLAGSVREGYGPGGKVWRTKMRYHYGEIRKTKGVDRDKLDVYIGPNPQSKKVFIVHQNFPGNHPKKAGKYDEDKVMLGFNSAEEAKRGYLKQYDRKDFFRSITEMPMTQFKKSVFGENKGEKVAKYKYITERELREYGTDPEKIRRAAKNLVDKSGNPLTESEKKIAEVVPWTEEERAQFQYMSPAERARAFYTGAGAYQATGGREDQEEYERQRKAREYTWAAEPELQEKWTRFMEQYPNWYPKQAACKAHKKGNPGHNPDKDTLVNKLRRFSKSRKKDRRPSAFIREKMKVGSLREAYELGAKTAIAAALMPAAPTPEKSTPGPMTASSFGVRLPSLPKGAPPPASSGASSGATQT